MELVEKLLDKRTVFKGRIVNLRVDTVRLPDGRRSEREVVEHKGAVAILALGNDLNVVMVKQYRHAIGRVIYEIPAGTLEDGEDPLDCAKREFEEETGLRGYSWEPILSYFSAPGFCNEELHLFAVEGFSQGNMRLDGDEFLEVVRVPLEDALNMIYKGEIVDGKSIIAIQHAYAALLRSKGV